MTPATFAAEALAVPFHLRFSDGDPLSPFALWCETYHRMSRAQARQVSNSTRTLFRHFSAEEVLAADPAEIALRVPHVANRREVGKALSAHGQPYRRAARFLQEWWGAGA